MTPNHIFDKEEAIEYLKEFEWVEGFDSVIKKLLEIKEQDDEGL
jgi:hypothetical protein